MEIFIYYILPILVLISIYLGFSYVLFKKIFYNFNHKPVDLVDENDAFYKAAYAWYEDIPKEDENITAYDGVKLHGVYIPSHDKKSEKLAIVIHGYQSKGRDMVIIAKMYSDLGFKVLLIDQRGHGYSSGKFTTMGHHEAYDLKKWLHYVTRRHGAHINVLLHGVSMGASTALLATKFGESKIVKTLILDACFTNFYDSLKRSSDNQFLKLFLPGISLLSLFIFKTTLRSINPLRQAKKTDIPTLLIHGKKDRVITDQMIQSIYEALQSRQKQILEIDDAKHAKAFEVDKGKYIDTVIAVVDKAFNLKKGDIKYTQ